MLNNLYGVSLSWRAADMICYILTSIVVLVAKGNFNILLRASELDKILGNRTYDAIKVHKELGLNPIFRKQFFEKMYISYTFRFNIYIYIYIYIYSWVIKQTYFLF